MAEVSFPSFSFCFCILVRVDATRKPDKEKEWNIFFIITLDWLLEQFVMTQGTEVLLFYYRSTLFYCKQTESLIIGWTPNFDFVLFQPFLLNLTDLMKFLPPVHSSSHCLCPLIVSISTLQVGRCSLSHQESHQAEAAGWAVPTSQRLCAQECLFPSVALTNTTAHKTEISFLTPAISQHWNIFHTLK